MLTDKKTAGSGVPKEAGMVLVAIVPDDDIILDMSTETMIRSMNCIIWSTGRLAIHCDDRETLNWELHRDSDDESKEEHASGDCAQDEVWRSGAAEVSEMGGKSTSESSVRTRRASNPLVIDAALSTHFARKSLPRSIQYRSLYERMNVDKK
jgi:hypothetical protein